VQEAQLVQASRGAPAIAQFGAEARRGLELSIGLVPLMQLPVYPPELMPGHRHLGRLAECLKQGEGRLVTRYCFIELSPRKRQGAEPPLLDTLGPAVPHFPRDGERGPVCAFRLVIPAQSAERVTELRPQHAAKSLYVLAGRELPGEFDCLV
jgi:hypothetical protein